MADPISGIGQSVLSQNLGQEKLKQQGSTPQETQGAAAQAPEQAEGVSGAKLEQMRLDLMNRVKGLPPGAPNVNALLPELIDTRTRLGMLRDVMGKSHGAPAGTDLRGRFGQVENEWNQVESVMRSNRDLSTTELLGLQARLYQ